MAEAQRLHDGLDFEKAAGMFRHALSKAIEGNDTLMIARARNKLTESLRKCERIEEAGAAGNENLDFCLQNWGWVHEETAAALENLGALAFITGQNTIHYTFFETALSINKELFGEDHLKVANDLMWLGNLYEYYADSANARHYLFSALSVWKKHNTGDDPGLAGLIRHIGLFYKRFIPNDSCQYYFNVALGMFDRLYGPANVESVKCINNLCDRIELGGDYTLALQKYHEALSRVKKIAGFRRNAEMMTFYNIAEFYFRKKEYDAALEYMQQVMKVYFPEFKPASPYANPVTNGLTFYPNLLVSADFKLEILNTLLESKMGDAVNIRKSIFELNRMIDLLQDQLRFTMMDFDNILEYEQYNSFENIYMGKTAGELFNETSDTVYASYAISYLLKNSLSIDFTTKRSNTFFNDVLPAELLSERQRTIERINDINNLLKSASPSLNPLQLKQQADHEKIRLNSINYRISQTGRQTWEEYRNYSKIFLGDIQKRITGNQALLIFIDTEPHRYFYPNKMLQVVVTKKACEFNIIGDPLIFDKTDTFHDWLSFDAATSTREIDSLGYQIYNILFHPIETLIGGKELIILPSKHIASVPVDFLPTKPGDDPERMIHKNLSWNIFDIYDLLDETPQPAFGKNLLLSVAPAFDRKRKLELAHLLNRDTSLIELPHALEECFAISRIISSDVLYGTDATEGSFVEKAGSYPLLHLSTHGIPDSNLLVPVKLAFSKSGGKDDGFLNQYEILNLGLRSEMVVLSACKTGYANRDQTLSAFNLGWAFRQSGARSVVFSLWDANDYASSVIMPDFYLFLAQGYTRPEALRMAKLKFIDAADNYMKHPFFWAGYQYYGKNEPVEALSEKQGKTVYLIIGLILIAMTAIILRFRKRRLMPA